MSQDNLQSRVVQRMKNNDLWKAANQEPAEVLINKRRRTWKTKKYTCMFAFYHWLGGAKPKAQGGSEQ